MKSSPDWTQELSFKWALRIAKIRLRPYARRYYTRKVGGVQHALIGKIEGTNQDGENRVGLVLYVQSTPQPGDTGYTRTQEVGRVARVRQFSPEPHKPFNDKIDEVVADAKKMIDVINQLETELKTLTANAGTLQ